MSSNPSPISIRMQIGALPDLVRPVRLAAGGIASLGDFDVESIEDLRLAVNELIVALFDQGDGTVDLTMSLTERGAFRMDATTAVGASGDAEKLAYSNRILSVMADEHEIAVADGLVSGWFVRHPDLIDEDGGGSGADIE